jgi:hypothetical protein
MEVAIKKHQTPRSKKIMDDLDKLLDGVELPSNEELKRETISAKTKKLHEDPNWKKKWARKNLAKKYPASWKQNQKAGILKKRQDPAWIENQRLGLLKRSQNTDWKQKIGEANRRKAQDPEWRKANHEAITENRGQPCAVKPPNKPWKHFRSVMEAVRYYDWGNLGTHPDNTFPYDGSVKNWRGARSGWQTKRIVD